MAILNEHNRQTGIAVGAIDLGGTKIEARLFDRDLNTQNTRRIPTPKSSFDDLVGALASQIDWMCERADTPDLPIGIGVPGFVRQDTKTLHAANLPTHGKDLIAAVEGALNRRFYWDNDCKAFAISEAVSTDSKTEGGLIGLILGTGVAGGMAYRGEMPQTLNGIALELGHIGLPARLLSQYDLPLLDCGCGRSGCFEQYIAGPGLQHLAKHAGLGDVDVPALIHAAKSGDRDSARVYDIWLDLVAELLDTIQLTHDPHVIVIGGGLSLIDGLPDDLGRVFRTKQFSGLQMPEIRTAKHGDSSGARGMAILAAMHNNQNEHITGSS